MATDIHLVCVVNPNGAIRPNDNVARLDLSTNTVSSARQDDAAKTDGRAHVAQESSSKMDGSANAKPARGAVAAAEPEEDGTTAFSASASSAGSASLRDRRLRPLLQVGPPTPEGPRTGCYSVCIHRSSLSQPMGVSFNASVAVDSAVGAGGASVSSRSSTARPLGIVIAEDLPHLGLRQSDELLEVNGESPWSVDHCKDIFMRSKTLRLVLQHREYYLASAETDKKLKNLVSSGVAVEDKHAVVEAVPEAMDGMVCKPFFGTIYAGGIRRIVVKPAKDNESVIRSWCKESDLPSELADRLLSEEIRAVDELHALTSKDIDQVCSGLKVGHRIRFQQRITESRAKVSQASSGSELSRSVTAASGGRGARGNNAKPQLPPVIRPPAFTVPRVLLSATRPYVVDATKFEFAIEMCRISLAQRFGVSFTEHASTRPGEGPRIFVSDDLPHLGLRMGDRVLSVNAVPLVGVALCREALEQSMEIILRLRRQPNLSDPGPFMLDPIDEGFLEPDQSFPAQDVPDQTADAWHGPAPDEVRAATSATPLLIDVEAATVAAPVRPWWRGLSFTACCEVEDDVVRAADVYVVDDMPLALEDRYDII